MNYLIGPPPAVARRWATSLAGPAARHYDFTDDGSAFAGLALSASCVHPPVFAPEK
jgi:hypothetical protein